jgi:hypothetical protein
MINELLGALATYAPKLYHYMCTTLKGVYENQPSLKYNFSNSIFPAATFNCGPETVTFNHRNFLTSPTVSAE